jgi:polyhydroxyalkanoate synthesis regulator phasin
MYKRLDPDHLYTSYKVYEIQVDHAVKTGRMTKIAARKLLEDAKKNYKNQNYNRQIDRIEK